MPLRTFLERAATVAERISSGATPMGCMKKERRRVYVGRE
jgi:hypothetical protein